VKRSIWCARSMRWRCEQIVLSSARRPCGTLRRADGRAGNLARRRLFQDQAVALEGFRRSDPPRLRQPETLKRDDATCPTSKPNQDRRGGCGSRRGRRARAAPRLRRAGDRAFAEAEAEDALAPMQSSRHRIRFRCAEPTDLRRTGHRCVGCIAALADQKAEVKETELPKDTRPRPMRPIGW